MESTFTQAREADAIKLFAGNQSMRGDGSVLLSLLSRLANCKEPEFEEIADNLFKLNAPVSRFFQLDKKQLSALEKMIGLTFVGRLFHETPCEQDPYAFEQLEWLFRESETLSVLATAMCLSMERADGSGKYCLNLDTIPLLSTVYRVLLECSQVTLNGKEMTAAVGRLTRRLNDYLDSDRVQKLMKVILSDMPKSSVEWINPMQLVPRMVVLEDVISPEGILLIAKNTRMTENMISTLLNYDCMRGITHNISVRPPM
ncbi:hypothetical protein [Reinekea marinisedimentorum]|uniref:Uncharacterized protein n=1 Tax=Reinekea marinisedimentorum TaxID=230495 RepID=A0A4V2UK16_9GAMM|nr:hypothetical protein [Reinekea marinisedimentorum]TCS42396.1 hypothetical protein BCF53_10357 [Reinekea marinisedimentorum]